ncbi:MAG: hypothetical protein JW880_06600 [Candidatus Thermoplasmatota archaeon]|nr:hypothetical protein [Candidatus Thermoplasmatota archaeon]
MGAVEIGDDKQDLVATLKRRRDEVSAYEEKPGRTGDQDLPFRWRAALNVYKSHETRQMGSTYYPRLERLFDIVREDGRIRLMLSYDEENPNPDFTDPGQRRQVEALLKFEQPLAQLIDEAEDCWRAGDFKAEAALLEEYAISNPQKDTILDLAAEARRDDALSGATSRSKTKRR